MGGFGIGIASNVSPVYIAEVSPAKVRGRLVSLNQLAIVVGILMAQIVNWQIGNHYTTPGSQLSADGVEWAWRWMFWAEVVPAGLFFVLSFVIPESPRWLAANGLTDKAAGILRRIGGQEHALETLRNISHVSGNDEHSASLADIFNPRVRRIMILGIVLAVFQQWCGINVIFNYAQEIFQAAGFDVSEVLMNIVVTGVTNLIFTFVAIYTVDRWGRRTLVLTGAIGLAAIYIVLGTCYLLGVHGWPMLCLVVMAIACYAMSLGPVVWVVLSEIFPVRVRGLAMAIATFFLWAACFVLTYTFPLLNNLMGAAGTFLLYAAICVVVLLYVRTALPETKGKNLEQIEKELTKQQP